MKAVLFWLMVMLAACTGGEAQTATPDTRRSPVTPTTSPTTTPTAIAPLEGITFPKRKQWGDGHLLDFAFHPTKSEIAIGGSLGIYIYDYLTSEQITFIPSKASRLRGISWSPDGSLLASGGNDGSIQIWQPETERLSLEFKAHEDSVDALEWSPDGRYLASSGDDDAVRVWDALDGIQIAESRQSGICCHVSLFGMAPSWSPDGERLAFLSGTGTLFIWDTQDWMNPSQVDILDILPWLEYQEMFSPVSWSRDSKLLTLGSQYTDLVIFDVGMGKIVEEINVHSFITTTQEVYWRNFGGAFSPTRDLLLHWDAHDMLHILDTNVWEELPPIQWEGENITKAEWSPDGAYLAAMNMDSVIRVYKLESRRSVSSFRLDGAYLKNVAWSPDGRFLPVVSDDQKLWLVSSQSLDAAATIDIPGKYLQDLFWVDEGETIGGFSSGFGNLYVWAASLSGNFQEFESDRSFGVEHFMGITEDGNLVGGRIISDETVETWDTQPSSEIAEFIWRQYAWREVLQAPHSNIYASVFGDTTIRVWEYPSGEEIALLEGPNEGIDFIQWSPAGNMISSVDEGGTLNVWDIESEQALITADGFDYPFISIAWSPDERMFAAADHQGNVYVWDVGTKEKIKHLEKGTKLIMIAWSPDGRLLAMGDHLGLISILDTAAWQEIAQLVGHTSMIYALSWSPDGSMLLSGSSDGTVRVWGLHEE